MPTFSAERFERLTAAIFERTGAPAEHARIVAEHLVAANLAGHDSHGVLRIPQYIEAIDGGKLNPRGTMQVVRRLPSGAVVDGNSGFGQVIARDAMLLAIEIARGSGIGAVTVRHCYHTGRIGTYTEMAAREKLIGLAVVNTGGAAQAVVPFGGLAGRLSTNPISIAAPSAGGGPIVLDMATSVAPEGKVRAHFLAGEKLPPGWLIDAAGQPSTDAGVFYGDPRGWLLPVGGIVGYKGFGLGVMIDILAGALSGAGASRPEAPLVTDGMLAMAIDAGQFAPLEEFEGRVAELAAHVKNCPTAPGYQEVLVPGEKEARTRQSRVQSGIPLSDASWEQIQQICGRLGVAIDL